MKKSLLFFFAAVLVLIGFFFRPASVQKPSPPQSEVALIYAYITRPKGFGINPADSCFYLIDTDFRTYNSTPTISASEAREADIRRVLSEKRSPALVQKLDLQALITPNTSQELQTLRAYAARRWGSKSNLFLLTFSAPCSTQDGKTYYYVERVFKENKKVVSANIFVLDKGGVQSDIPIWTT